MVLKRVTIQLKLLELSITNNAKKTQDSSKRITKWAWPLNTVMAGQTATQNWKERLCLIVSKIKERNVLRPQEWHSHCPEIQSNYWTNGARFSKLCCLRWWRIVQKIRAPSTTMAVSQHTRPKMEVIKPKQV